MNISVVYLLNTIFHNVYHSSKRYLENCTLCGEKESLVVSNDMKTMETIDERLKALGGKKISTVVDGHCPMWAWTRGFHIPKSSARAVLSEELLSQGCYYAHFLVRNSFRLMLKTILEKKIYREGDMDI